MDLGDLLQIVGLGFEASLLRRTAFETVIASPACAAAALSIPFLAGVSEMAGQAIVLAVRRVHPWRAVASFALTGLVYVTAVALWTATAWTLLDLDGLGSSSVLKLMGVASLGYAPRLLSALTIAPYYGELLGRALDGWSMAVVGWGICIVTDGLVATVLAIAALGWLGSTGLRHFGGWLVKPVLGRLGVVTAGMGYA